MGNEFLFVRHYLRYHEDTIGNYSRTILWASIQQSIQSVVPNCYKLWVMTSASIYNKITIQCNTYNTIYNTILYNFLSDRTQCFHCDSVSSGVLVRTPEFHRVVACLYYVFAIYRFCTFVLGNVYVYVLTYV